jgi:hypothetical protein
MESRSFAASLGRRRMMVLAVALGWVGTDMGGREVVREERPSC